MNTHKLSTAKNEMRLTATALRPSKWGRKCLALTITILSLNSSPARSEDRLIKEGGFNGPVNAISEPDANGTRYVGGDFTSYGKWLTGGGAVVDTWGNGSVNPTFPKVNGEVYASVADGSGGFFIGGAFDSVDGVPRSNAAHIEADGSLGPWAPQPNGSVRAMMLVGSTVYMGGGFSQVGGVARAYAAAVNFAGTVDDLWKPAPNGKVYALAFDGSNIYLGGAFTEVNGSIRNHIASVALSGDLNPTWAPDVNGAVLTITTGTTSTNAPEPGAMMIYFGGEFTEVNGTVRNHAAAVGLDGALGGWDPNVDGTVNALVCTTGAEGCRNIAIGGSFTQVGGTPRNNLASWYYYYDVLWFKYFQGLSDFKPNPNGPISALAVSNGQIHAGGDFTEVAGSSRKYVAAFTDEFGEFNEWRPEPDGPVLSLSIETKDQASMYIGGAFSTTRAEQRSFAAALNSDGALNSMWRPNLRGPGGVDAILLSEGTVFVGGRFTSVDWDTRQGVAALDTTAGNLQEAFNPTISGGNVQAIAAIGDRVYLGGTFTQIGTSPRNYLASLFRINGGVETDWDAQIDTGEGFEVSALATSGNTLFIGGNFNRVRGLSRYNAAAITTTGELTPWSPAFSGNVNALTVDGSVVYVGGDFDEASGVSVHNAAAIGLDGSIIGSWAPRCDFPVKAVHASTSDVYLGGDFTHVDGEAIGYIAAVGKDGTLRSDWHPNLNNSVAALSIADSAIFVGGRFTKSDEVQSDYLALLDPATGSDIPIPTPTATPSPTPTPLPTATPTAVPPTPTFAPQPVIGKPLVNWSPNYLNSSVRAYVTRVKGVSYSISATSSGAQRTGRCSIDRRTRKTLCAIDLPKGTWLASVYPHKQGVTGPPTRRRFRFTR